MSYENVSKHQSYRHEMKVTKDLSHPFSKGITPFLFSSERASHMRALWNETNLWVLLFFNSNFSLIWSQNLILFKYSICLYLSAEYYEISAIKYFNFFEKGKESFRKYWQNSYFKSNFRTRQLDKCHHETANAHNSINLFKNLKSIWFEITSIVIPVILKLLRLKICHWICQKVSCCSSGKYISEESNLFVKYVC